MFLTSLVVIYRVGSTCIFAGVPLKISYFSNAKFELLMYFYNPRSSSIKMSSEESPSGARSSITVARQILSGLWQS